MQAFGFFTLGILLIMLVGIEAVSSDPCSQFSDPARQSLCTSDNFPAMSAEEMDWPRGSDLQVDRGDRPKLNVQADFFGGRWISLALRFR